MLINMLKHGFIFFIATCLHALSNYVCFGLGSSLGYAGKTNSFAFKLFEIIEYVLWLPLGVLGYTKFWFIMEWNYPAMLIVNSFLAVGIIYLLIFLKKPLWSKNFIVVTAICLLWLAFAILGTIFFPKK